MFGDNDTIAAPATAPGGALSIIRLSGARAVECADAVFRGRRALADAAPATLHYGRIVDGERTVDDVVVSLFRAPHSYTGEDSVEISCHGSQYIVSEILRLLTAAGARLAAPGEFTSRAFLAGRIDLSQAEAVADMIAADSRAAHAMASTQMRGAYSESLHDLRDRLLRLTSLLELELDFSEEDVAFADRAELRRTMQEIAVEIDRLTGSFTLGNAIKEGVAVAIVGAPNAGKSTLLNRLLGEERAMVSDIAGTTRDTVEERMNIDGVTFRFIDTAGLRDTDDRLEALGIERTRDAISRANIVISLTTPGNSPEPVALHDDQRLITVINKIDLIGRDISAAQQHTADAHTTESAPDDESCPNSTYAARNRTAMASDIENNTADPAAERSAGDSTRHSGTASGIPALCGGDIGERTQATNSFGRTPEVRISALNGEGIDNLISALSASVDTRALYAGDAIVSSARHREALAAAGESLAQALEALAADLPADLLSEDIRSVIHHLGTITGEITSDDILRNIFSKFCIGK